MSSFSHQSMPICVHLNEIEWFYCLHIFKCIFFFKNTNDTRNKFGLVNRYPCVRFYGSLFAACLPGRLCHFGWLNFQQVKATHSNSRSTAYSWSSLFIRMLEGCYHPETIRCRNKVLILFIGCIKFMMAALDRWNTNCALQQCEGLLTTSHISLNAFSLRSPLFQDI